jgi:aminoglycoside phosphotransferase (APT) family kinase protein
MKQARSAAGAPEVLNSHPDRLVRLADGPGGRQVVKRYLDGSGPSVYTAMLALWGSPFGAARHPPGLPRPLWLDRETGDLAMEFVAGEPIGARGDLGSSVERLPEVALLLADLHASGVNSGRRRDAAALLRSCRRKVADLQRDAPQGRSATRLAALADRLMYRLEPALLGRRSVVLVPSHGDFSPRNVLASPAGLVLIDFDRLQNAEPARDIAYWGAWTWVTQLCTGTTPSWAVGDELAQLYVDAGGRLVPGDGDPAYRAAALLRIAHGWSALARRPDLAAEVLAQAHRLLR